MEQDKYPVDDLFRETLSNHEIAPSAEAKAAFLKEANAIISSRNERKRWIIYLSSLIILVAIGTLTWINLPVHSDADLTKTHAAGFNPVTSSLTSNSNDPSPAIKSSENHTSVLPKKMNEEGSSTRIKVKHRNQISSPEPKTQEPSTAFNQNSSEANEKSHTSNQPVSLSAIEVRPSINETEPSTIPVTTTTNIHIATKEQPGMSSNEPTPAPPIQMNGSDEVNSLNSAPVPADALSSKDTLHPSDNKSSNDKKDKHVSPTRNFQLSTAVYVTPEWLHNIIGTEKYVTNFGLEETFYFGKYSIRSGLGLSITKGTNELSIAYNEYLGSYKQLDSMAFAWNQQHTDLLPTYYLSDKDVWDSLMKLENTQIVKRYTYLQVPLVLGYDFWSNEQFSFGARVGPILSVLLATKQLTDNYDPGKDKIILINEITPERIQTNWQIMAGLAFGFGNTRRVGIEFEPEVRYYFNSVYEKSGSTQKPWSIGFHIALLLKY